jgi:N-acetyltransferase 10
LHAEAARKDINEFFTAYDMKRLHAYAQELVDYHLITDLLPALARFYFLDRYEQKNYLIVELTSGRFGSAKVAPTQAQILIAMGLQYKTIEETSVCCILSHLFDLTLFLSLHRKRWLSL